MLCIALTHPPKHHHLRAAVLSLDNLTDCNLCLWYRLYTHPPPLPQRSVFSRRIGRSSLSSSQHPAEEQPFGGHRWVRLCPHNRLCYQDAQYPRALRMWCPGNYRGGDRGGKDSSDWDAVEVVEPVAAAKVEETTRQGGGVFRMHNEEDIRWILRELSGIIMYTCIYIVQNQRKNYANKTRIYNCSNHRPCSIILWLEFLEPFGS